MRYESLRNNIEQNKKQKDKITAYEWNTLFTMLATQGNHLDTWLQHFDDVVGDYVLDNGTIEGRLIDLEDHEANKQNPHNVTKSQVGLGNVINEKQATEVDFNTHTNNTGNPHNVTKAQVGLGNADDTSDMDKPVSNAQASAITDAVNTHETDEQAHEGKIAQLLDALDLDGGHNGQLY